ncbi:DNA primase [Hyphomicrobium sp.]|uniref:DNA primase n=1 Tax=Hyphomicrobium sp. TaxID=82 RepID=UPI001D42CD7F|nr:DNA primase [Hyphomicrobium sp.]MBY0559303.1 DNA primase [Hyphomicrobium sp.]
MRFSPNLLDEIRSRLLVSQVVGRKVVLKKSGREFRGLSPFKAEKSPSFFVNDQKGFYHCFASGEHGDIFTFLMKTEGLEFPEAVERLAAEAGVPMPKAAERNVEQEDQRERLYRLLEASAAFFEASLRAGIGSEARGYLERRGLAQETIQTFRLGFAPNSRSALSAHLKGKGFSAADMATAGMLISGDDIPEPYDRFRNRVIFPILDLKGRVIAFGGRALDKEAPAKYLNSPETPLFHKGHILFNAARARTAAHDKNRVIAVEGYMDVVALAEAGFVESVAPLGTALTEDQLKLLWRFAPEPLLCFDGDGAGRKAADRAVEIALPLVKPGFSVAFAFLPDGLDPDDLIRQRGAGAMTEVLEKTRPLIDVLWDREVKAQPIGTPEQRAALEARLKALTESIQDATVRSYYSRELRDRLYQLGRERFSAQARGAGGPSVQASYARPVAAPDWRGRERYRLSGPEKRFPKKPAYPGAMTASPELVSHFQSILPREALILKTLINHPWLIDEHSEAVAVIEFASPAISALRDEILAVHARQNSLDSATLRTQLSKSGVAKVVDLVARTITHKSDRFAEPDASATDVEAAWHHILALQQRQAELGLALKNAEEAWYRDCTEDAENRLLDIKRQIARETAAEQMDEFDQPDDDNSDFKRAG